MEWARLRGVNEKLEAYNAEELKTECIVRTVLK